MNPPDIDKAIAELEAEAKKHEGGSAMQLLLKAVIDNSNQLWELVKGRPAPPAKDDDEGGDAPPAKDDDEGGDAPPAKDDDEGGDDEGDDDEGGDADSAGYRDMMLSRQADPAGQAADPTRPTHLDVTEWILSMGGKVDALTKAVETQAGQLAALVVENTKLRTQNGELATLVKANATASLGSVVELAKGVTSLREDVAKIPGLPPSMRGSHSRALPPPSKDPKTFLGGTERLQAQTLAKARANSVIDAGELRSFNQTGRFCVDPARHAEKLAQVEEIATQLSATSN